MNEITGIGRIGGLDELGGSDRAPKAGGGSFADALKSAVRSVDELQRESDVAQTAFAQGEDVELHDVLIKVEEAEIAFRAMMEVRNKLIDAYQQVMRMGSGG